MSPEELEIQRINFRLLALENVVSMLIRGFAKSLPNGQQQFVEILQKMKEDSRRIPLKLSQPEYADMLTDEYYKAVDGLVSALVKNIER